MSLASIQSNHVTNSIVLNELESSTAFFYLSDKTKFWIATLSTEFRQIAKTRTIAPGPIEHTGHCFVPTGWQLKWGKRSLTTWVLKGYVAAVITTSLW